VGFTADEAERLARELEGLAWVRKLPATNPYERLRAEAEGALFVVWRSGKLSYQGPQARAVLEEIAQQAGLRPSPDGPTEVGSDEAGKGEWLGPMVAAAVAVRPGQHFELRLDGVRDSKDLSGEARTLLVERIRAHAAAANVVVIGPKRFNELWDELHARGQNLNDLLWWAHRKALEPVLGAVAKDTAVRVVLDEFDRTRRAADQLRAALPAHAKVEQRPRGEEVLAVAAASVLARAERDRQVEQLRARFALPADLAPEQARAHPSAAEFAKLAWLRPRA
jgi:ribonuclease HIII